jgi:hypothetical protein
MAGGLPAAEDVLAVVRELIARFGADAFRTDGRIRLYSGPRDLIAEALPEMARNQVRARAQAARTRAALIEHTRIGRYLGTVGRPGNIYRYFDERYAERFGPRSKQAFRQADRVMRETSREFIKAAFGNVATAVCGAAADRIFFEVELPAMVANDAIEAINGLPAGLVRDFYRIDPYEAFRVICIAELLEARRYAAVMKSPKSRRDTRRDYRERRRFFIIERRATLERGADVPANDAAGAQIKRTKRRLLARYRIMADMAAMIAADPPPPAAPVRRIATRFGAHVAAPHDAA